MAHVHEAIAAAIPNRDCIVWGDKRWTWAQITDRTRRLANYLIARGVAIPVGREFLDGDESGQDHLGIYLYNGNEYLEAMLGAYKARVAPFNINYRYVAEELRYLLLDSNCRILVYHSAFAPMLAEIRDQLPNLEILLQVADDSGNALLPGAVDYEEALASASPERPEVQVMGGDWSPDDLYILYTGGTTGMPKGVLWRQNDIFMSTMGGRTPGIWDPVATYDDITTKAQAGAGDTMVLIPPFMHGAAQWASFIMMSNGARIVVPDENTRMDPADVLRTVERERGVMLTVVGDAVMRPLLAELETGRYDLSSLAIIGNGSAPLTPAIKERVLEILPNIFINDSVGSSETGAQGSHLSAKGNVSTGTFTPGPGSTVVTADLSAVETRGHSELGWFAQQGWVPLGYLGDPEKTARTFPVIAGVRYAVPGDRARLKVDGNVELLGRDSVTINTGGEKVFAEEVESAIASHPAVYDVTVCGRPSERWGSEVVAVVALATPATPEELEAHAALSIARYKLPKGWVFVEKVQRSPSGKADYRWAASVAATES